jgi:hypothetical protein
MKTTVAIEVFYKAVASYIKLPAVVPCYSSVLWALLSFNITKIVCRVIGRVYVKLFILPRIGFL